IFKKFSIYFTKLSYFILNNTSLNNIVVKLITNKYSFNSNIRFHNQTGPFTFNRISSNLYWARIKFLELMLSFRGF
ncbi:hypothetical protein K469DRAFT_549976, partial [Zopfia rhizophila CBS 207.26]